MTEWKKDGIDPEITLDSSSRGTSMRPSNRRRRRPRLELQLERLEDRQLLSVPTSSSPVLFHDTFSSNTPSSAWSFASGTWQINKGVSAKPAPPPPIPRRL